MSLPSDYCPQLRWPLEVKNTEVDGSPVVVLSDNYEVALHPIAVPAPLMPIIVRFDGKTSLQAIAEEGAPYGLTEEFVCRLAEDLSSLLFLETPESKAKWNAIQEEFRNSPMREASLAGLVYPAEAKELKKALKGYLENAKAEKAPPKEAVENIVGLICPHIDYQRGWQTYGATFKSLKNMQKPDVVFIFGTAHQSGSGFFHLTGKDFATPLGTVSVAKELVAEIDGKYVAAPCLQDQILHKKEHSIELQLPFLQYLFKRQGCPEIVPVLTGSFYPFLVGGRRLEDAAEITDFVVVLADITKRLRAEGKRVLFYGGVDLAHVGLAFGDEQKVSDSGLSEIEARDRALLEAALAGDEKLVFEHIAEDSDKRRVCGFPAIYTMLAVMRLAGISLEGHLIEYRLAVEPETDCIVSFAGACWSEAKS